MEMPNLIGAMGARGSLALGLVAALAGGPAGAELLDRVPNPRLRTDIRQVSPAPAASRWQGPGMADALAQIERVSR